MRLTVLFFSAARASCAKASVSMPIGNAPTCIRRPSISHQSPLSGSPGIGGDDAIAEIVGVGLGLKTNDIIGAESSEESADRRAWRSPHPAPAMEYAGKSQSGWCSPSGAKNAPWE